MWKRLMNLLLTVVIALGLFCLLLMWREPSMLYYPDRTPFATPPPPFEDLHLTASDGIKIHGWLVPTPGARLTVLFLHGNAGNISHRLDKIDILRQLGANVCIIDYRGYGRSEGTPNEQGTYRDAQAAYEYLTKTLPVRRSLGEGGNQKPGTILLYGESLGSAVAVELATRVATAGVILEEPFTSVGDVGQKMFPFLPVRWLVRNKYDTLRKIAHIHAPLLIFHSRQDEFFSFRHAERLLAAAHEPKQLVELHGSHNEAFFQSLETYRRGLHEFFEKLAAGRAPR